MMNVNTAQATAAPSEVVLGDRKFKVGPLRDNDYGEFEAWVQDRLIAVTKRNLEGLSTEDARMLLQDAFERASTITFSSPQSIDLMTSIEGAAKLTWLGIRRYHPEVTEQEILHILTDPDVLAQAMEAHDLVNERHLGPIKDETKEGEEPGN